MMNRLIVICSLATAVLFADWVVVLAAGPDRTLPPGVVVSQSPENLARGAKIYAEHCAQCHGAKLEGEPDWPDWKKRKPNGRLPAPPHDETGHTWHHKDEVLFVITKIGPAAFLGDASYESDMPAFDGVLSDQEIADVLGYIKGHWSGRARQFNDRVNAAK